MMAKDKQNYGRGAVTVNSTDPVKPFDYALLTSEARVVVQQKTGEIRKAMSGLVDGIFEVGTGLIAVKEQLKHGQWLRWLDAEFGWSDQTARNYMNVAENMGQIQNRFEFAPKALYLLAQKSTPESARKAAIERADAGETITPKIATAIIQEHKPVTTPPKKSFAVTYTAPVDDYVDDVPAVELESTYQPPRPVSPLPTAGLHPFTRGAQPTGAALIQPGMATPNGHDDGYRSGFDAKGGTPPLRAPEIRRGGCYAESHDEYGVPVIIDTKDGRILSLHECVILMNAKPVTVSTPAPEPTLELVSASLGIDKADMIELASDHTPKVITLLARAVEAMPEQPENPLEVLTLMVLKMKAAKKVKAGKKPAVTTPSNHRELFGEICKVFGYAAKLTTAEKSRVGKVAKELAAVGADVLDIAGLHRYCQQHYDKFTDAAFLTNWSAYQATKPKKTSNVSNLDDVPFTDASAAAVLSGMRIITADAEGQPA